MVRTADTVPIQEICGANTRDLWERVGRGFGEGLHTDFCGVSRVLRADLQNFIDVDWHGCEFGILPYSIYTYKHTPIHTYTQIHTYTPAYRLI